MEIHKFSGKIYRKGEYRRHNRCGAEMPIMIFEHAWERKNFEERDGKPELGAMEKDKKLY